MHKIKTRMPILVTTRKFTYLFLHWPLKLWNFATQNWPDANIHSNHVSKFFLSFLAAWPVQIGLKIFFFKPSSSFWLLVVSQELPGGSCLVNKSPNLLLLPVCIHIWKICQNILNFFLYLSCPCLVNKSTNLISLPGYVSP